MKDIVTGITSDRFIEDTYESIYGYYGSLIEDKNIDVKDCVTLHVLNRQSVESSYRTLSYYSVIKAVIKNKDVLKCGDSMFEAMCILSDGKLIIKRYNSVSDPITNEYTVMEIIASDTWLYI